ncbi:MAG: type II toxin-antitoxin system VapC family toxin [Kiritimatiellia bacterium]
MSPARSPGRCVVDATWVVDCLIGEDQVRGAALTVGERFPLRISPSLWRYEAGNALRQMVRAGRRGPDEAALLLAAAEPLVSETFEPVDTADVLRFADEHGLKTFYDASYAWLADRLGVRLFTRDREVLRACPGLASAYAD